MPGHCYKSPKTAPKAKNIDYSAVWLANDAVQQQNVANSQDEVDSLLCNIMRSRDANIPRKADYENNGESFNTGWGIATSGVQIFNAISAMGVDPFYPAKYGTVTDLD